IQERALCQLLRVFLLSKLSCVSQIKIIFSLNKVEILKIEASSTNIDNVVHGIRADDYAK
ncbi:hypothetical protein RCJ22_30290, partial [Vibrio sp. FNV 38]|nr:hypothetical protein [Vibrio sp. FNV 38]